MKHEAYTVLIIAIGVIILGTYGLIRSWWLYHERVRILDEDFKAFCSRGYVGDPRPRYEQIKDIYNNQFWSF